MKDTRFQRFLKRRELSVRRAFIAFLSRRSQNTAALPLELPSSPKILFLRQDRLGDAIITTPLLVAIAYKYPSAHLMMLLGENNKGIAPLLPIQCEKFIYRKSIIRDIAMLLHLRRQKIDVLIDLMDNASMTSSIIAGIIGARYTVGIEKENASAYNVIVPRIDRGRYHIARRIAELARPFGIDPESIDLKPKLSVTKQRTVRGRVGINVTAGIAARSLPAEITAKIATAIAGSEWVTEVLIYADPEKVDLVNEIISMAQDNKIKAAPLSSSYAEFASELSSCEYVVATDTSALHLASAMGIPVVGLYLTHSPDEHYWKPLGAPYEMIIKDSLIYIDAEEVAGALETLYEKTGMHKGLVMEEAL